MEIYKKSEVLLIVISALGTVYTDAGVLIIQDEPLRFRFIEALNVPASLNPSSVVDTLPVFVGGIYCRYYYKCENYYDYDSDDKLITHKDSVSCRRLYLG